MPDFTDTASRVLSLGDAIEWREKLRLKGRKLVVTNGCFDILHRGHATYLAEARALGDALLILVNSDSSVRALKGPERPLNDEYSRAYLLCSLRAVDAATVFPDSRCHVELEALAPDIYVKGGDYTIDSLDPDERAALLASGTEIVFKPFVPGFSTTGILEKSRK